MKADNETSLIIGGIFAFIGAVIAIIAAAQKNADEEKARKAQAEEAGRQAIARSKAHQAQLAANAAREKRIYVKYEDRVIADKIVNRVIWTGETAEQLEDSLGIAADVDEKVLKTKKKQVWKYNPKGANRYGLRITLDDDIVVGWDEKL